MINHSQIDEEISKLLDLTQELINLDKLDEAEKFLAEVEKYVPNDPNVPFQRGLIFEKKSEHEKAIEQFMIVHANYPNQFENLTNIAAAYFKLRKFDDAVIFYKRSLELKPKMQFVLASLATCLNRRGSLDESIDYFRQALELSPHSASVHSDLLLTMIYAESVSPEALKEEAEKYGQYFAAIYPEKTDFVNKKTTNRKLRIGYVSSDFRDHPIPYFLEPLLRHHNKEKFEIYAYSNTLYDNPVMERMKPLVDFWRDTRGLEVLQTRDVIVQDNIDILIDANGHTANNSLPVFVSRAAPIQVTWLGFPATTGIQTMDYRITDNYAEPPGMTEHLNTETLWRMPRIFCVYEAHQNSPSVIDHPPFEDNGFVTFGCFNNFIKVRDPVLALWSRILEQVPHSKLLLEIEAIDEPEFRKRVEDRLLKQNIPLDRVILEVRSRENQFVLYNKIDIALDPFPCCGGTTTMDALWMGAPVVTLAGKHFGSRMGVTVLTNGGVPELIAQNADEYVSIASDLAKDNEKLKKIRHNLRERFSKSPAMDQKLFVDDMEEAYLGMWQKHCSSQD